MELRTGTSGFAYKAWNGPFYPEGADNEQMLRFYGEHLTAVEINNTFYRMPKTSVLERWAAATPDSFRFVIKASRRITHKGKLEDSDESVAYLYRQLEALGDKLGAVLFQCPPYLKKNLDRLQRFLDTIPADQRVAMEFRSRSWYDDEVVACLRAREVALCVAANHDDDLDSEESKTAPLVATARFGYFRLRAPSYDDEQLQGWLARIDEQPWEQAFVFFKHEEQAAAPLMARRMTELRASETPLRPPRKASPRQASPRQASPQAPAGQTLKPLGKARPRKRRKKAAGE
jgi:uncharacterized protein YecE (DUF72 family)